MCGNMPVRVIRFFNFRIKENASAIFALPNNCLQRRTFRRSSPFSSRAMKVAILGATNKTGTCLSLFLKRSPLIDELAIYDYKPTRRLALELNYIDTGCKVNTCNSSEKCLEQTLLDAKIVMIVADKTHSGTSILNDALSINAETLSDLLPSVIKFCPRAMVAIVMSPINSLIPLATEMFKKAGIYEYNRLFGVTTLDCARANTFVAELVGIEPECVMIPVIGGSCPQTCIPVFSQAKPSIKLSQEEASRLTHAVRMSDFELSKLNKQGEIASFALAFAAARFCVSLCKALRHQKGVVECAYVRCCVIPEVTYFASPLELGPDGIQKHLTIPPLSDYECGLLRAAIPILKGAIARGEALALGDKNKSTESCPRFIDTCNQTLGPPQPAPQ